VEPLSIPGRKCLCCNGMFLPSPGNRATQRFCSEATCRKASRARCDRQWRHKNPGYHSGPEQVERVRQWRARHPGYSRGKRRGKAPPPLQDLAPAQVVAAPPLADDAAAPPRDFLQKAPASTSGYAATTSCNGAPLQDFVHPQDPLLVGLIATMLGGALQESFVPFTQELVERGRRVLAQNCGSSGLQAASPTSNST
jgi:hypothetical protein